VLLTVVSADERGVRGRDAAVSETGYYKARRQQHGAVGFEGQKQHAGSEDEQQVHRHHCAGPAEPVEHAAEHDAACAVKYGYQPHDGGHGSAGHRGRYFPHYAAGLRYNGQACGGENDGPEIV